MKQGPHRVKILDEQAVKARLRRMAYEIYEKNYEQDKVVIIGINGRGGYLAGELCEILAEISPLKVERLQAGKAGRKGIDLPTGAAGTIAGQVVVIVDDVLYSGLTLFYALAAVMEFQPAKVQTAVLIDRGHRHVPVSHDFVGMKLATSLQQYVSVEVMENERKAVAYLF